MNLIVRGSMGLQDVVDAMNRVERGASKVTEIDEGVFEVEIAPIRIEKRRPSEVLAAVHEGFARSGRPFAVGEQRRQHLIKTDHRGRPVGIVPASGVKELTPEAVAAAVLELAHRHAKTDPKWRALGDAVRGTSTPHGLRTNEVAAKLQTTTIGAAAKLVTR